MAESIADAMHAIDAVGNEHTDPDAGTAVGAERIAAELGVPYDELLAAVAEIKEVQSISPQSTVVVTGEDLERLLAAMVISGVFYGVRWERNRGE